MSGRAVRSRRAILAGCFVALLLCAGCQPQFNRQSYETIYRGEPAQEVQRKLGPPERSTPECWDYVGRRPSHFEARIWFRDGQVTRKEWFDRKELFKDGE